MTKDEVEFLIAESVEKLRVEHAQTIRGLEERIAELKKARSHTVQEFARRITQLGG